MEEALSLLTSLEGRDHPVYLLLEDLVSLSLPAGAVYLRERSRIFGWQNFAQGRIPDHPELRVSVYDLPMSVEEFESHCAKLWPEFRLHTPTDADEDGQDVYIQYLRKRDGVWNPALDASEIPEGEASEGIILTLMPGHLLPPQALQQFSREPGSTFSLLVLINLRQFETEPAGA